ncbi:hypothetical protein BpHYR1_050785 [Brachionus plicatilis]|uniref:Uncharacterized protein n=1 Tax=Brachionus plicatilis TaxID=10195 RepID=A0A3M7PTL5_BRAPC|nr:hypothetical protein BpHYR1_050785 [Brachionus plicatilis]
MCVSQARGKYFAYLLSRCLAICLKDSECLSKDLKKLTRREFAESKYQKSNKISKSTGADDVVVNCLLNGIKHNFTNADIVNFGTKLIPRNLK